MVEGSFFSVFNKYSTFSIDGERFINNGFITVFAGNASTVAVALDGKNEYVGDENEKVFGIESDNRFVPNFSLLVIKGEKAEGDKEHDSTPALSLLLAVKDVENLYNHKIKKIMTIYTLIIR